MVATLSDELKEMQKTLTTFMLKTTEIVTELGVNQRNLTKSVDKMGESTRLSVESNNALKEQILSLEAKAISKLDAVESTVSENSSDIRDVKERLTTLESIEAYKSGQNDNKEKSEKKWLNKWQWALGLIVASTAVITLMNTLINGIKST